MFDGVSLLVFIGAFWIIWKLHKKGVI